MGTHGIPTNHSADLPPTTRDRMKPIIDILNTIPVTGLQDFTFSAHESMLLLQGPEPRVAILLDGVEPPEVDARSLLVQIRNEIEDTLNDLTDAIDWLIEEKG